jgi:hypothetical protein
MNQKYYTRTSIDANSAQESITMTGSVAKIDYSSSKETKEATKKTMADSSSFFTAMTQQS